MLKSRRFIAVFLVIAVGCQFTVPVNPNIGPTPLVVEHPPAPEVWTTLAQYVECGIIATPQMIERYVKILVDNGDLTAGEASKIDSAFPKASTDTSDLNAKEAGAKLRKLATGQANTRSESQIKVARAAPRAIP
jgi:hypothetical protein